MHRELFINELSKHFDDSCFSHYAKNLLFDYFTQLEEQKEEELELNCVQICTEWNESEINHVVEAHNLSKISELLQYTSVIRSYKLEDGKTYVLFKSF